MIVVYPFSNTKVFSWSYGTEEVKLKLAGCSALVPSFLGSYACVLVENLRGSANLRWMAFFDVHEWIPLVVLGSI
jgi:hypothetical protein